MTPELEMINRLIEYGPVGILAGVLYLIARMYAPHFSALAEGLKAIPPAIAALTAQIGQLEETVEGQGDDLRNDLAVLKDRLPRIGALASAGD